MPDREAIIEAMAEAAALNDPVWPGETVDDLSRDDRARYRAMAEAAYDTSPIERYRKALEEIREATWRLLPTSTPKPNGRADAISHVFTIAQEALQGDDSK